MSGNHWSDDDLIDHLYGLRVADEHFASCEECAARNRMMAEKRLAITQPPEVSQEFLAAQRRSIYQRLGSPVRLWHPLRWAVATTATAALVLGLMFFPRHEALQPRTDEQFYAEISSLDQNPTPRAVQPIESLVEDDTQE